MFYNISLMSIIKVMSETISFLISVAFVTLAERKTMASMQRRVGPNRVGLYGILQPFADAIKLLLKEYILPALSNQNMFTAAAIITLMFSLFGLGVVPYGPGSAIADLFHGILYLLATFSIATYGILTAGWAANSKYAFLGALRSTAQLISYELLLTSAILLVAILWGTFNLSSIVENQKSVWSSFPLAPTFYVFFKTCLAETNRAPFDLAEAESELVSGYITEHAASAFVSFFLGEYSSIVLISIFTSVLYLGGYLINFEWIKTYEYLINLVTDFTSTTSFIYYISVYNLYHNIVDGSISSSSICSKAIVLIFTFIWVRASFPRIRFDQLITYCWTNLLPILVALIITIPCLLYGLEIIPSNEVLFISVTCSKNPRTLSLFKSNLINNIGINTYKEKR